MRSPGASGVEVDCVDGSKVSLNTANLLLKNLVHESDLELSSPAGGGGDIHGLLTSSADDVIPGRRDGCRVQGPVVLVQLQLIQVDIIELQRNKKKKKQDKRKEKRKRKKEKEKKKKKKKESAKCLPSKKRKSQTLAVMSLEEVMK